MQKYIFLNTERLLLRPALKQDAAFILKLFNTPKWIAHIGDRNVHSIEDAEKYIENRMTPQLERLGYGNFLVMRKEDGAKIGTCGLYDREGLEGIDIGFAFLPEFEKKGYAFEAASRMKQAAIHDFGIKEIKAITVEYNVESRNLIEKLGLSFVKKFYMEGDSEELMLYNLKVK
jgi:[ribosomal protein S5]-alanine N-acetyltransferase